MDINDHFVDEILKNNHNVNIVYRFWTYSKENQHFQNVIHRFILAKTLRRHRLYTLVLTD